MKTIEKAKTKSSENANPNIFRREKNKVPKDLFEGLRFYFDVILVNDETQEREPAHEHFKQTVLKYGGKVAEKNFTNKARSR